METNHTKALLVVGLILQKEEKVLLSLRENTGRGDGLYSLVGGRVDRGEGMVEAMIREAREEVGIALRPADLSFFMLLQAPIEDNPEYDNVLYASFIARTWEGEIVNNEPKKCGDVRFFPLTDLPKNLTRHTDEVLRHVISPAERPPYGYLPSML